MHAGLIALCIIGGGVATEVLRVLVPRSKPSLHGEKARRETKGDLLPTPEGYEGLQGAGVQLDNDVQGLIMGPLLGAGSYGQVYHGRWRGARVAVKIIRHEGADHKGNIVVAREAVIGAALAHPNIVKVFLVSTRRLDTADPAPSETAIVMDYCDRDTLYAQREVVWELLEKDYAAGLRWLLRCLSEIAAAMEYMHSLGLVHGDLKCNNVLLQSTRSEARGFICKLSDMGCSRLLSAGRIELLTGTYGSPWYAAPELLKEGSLTQASDVYSFAIIAWHLLSCGDDFFRVEPPRVYVQIVDLDKRPPFPERTDLRFKTLIESCWQSTPSKRPSFQQVQATLQVLHDQSLLKQTQPATDSLL